MFLEYAYIKYLDNILSCETKKKQFNDDKDSRKCIKGQSTGKIPIFLTDCRGGPLNVETSFRCFSNGHQCPDPEVKKWLKDDEIRREECKGKLVSFTSLSVISY